jgi:hypothetical protein
MESTAPQSTPSLTHLAVERHDRVGGVADEYAGAAVVEGVAALRAHARPSSEKRLVIKSRLVSTPLAFSGQLQPRLPNV